MRKATAARAVLALVVAGVSAGDSIARWEQVAFFARRPGQTVPPPAFYATTEEMPEGAEVKIKVLQCPKDAHLQVHRFIGGPVFSTGSKDYGDLAADTTVTHKLDKKMRVGLTTSLGGQQGRCKALERKDGHDILTYSFGDSGEMRLEVEVAGK